MEKHFGSGFRRTQAAGRELCAVCAVCAQLRAVSASAIVYTVVESQRCTRPTSPLSA
jgi:hypothetical protein